MAAGPKPQPLSPKSNWVSNVQALKGVGAAKVGESFDEEANAVIKPVKKITDDELDVEESNGEGNAVSADVIQQTPPSSKKNTKKSKKPIKSRTASPTKPDSSLPALTDENNHAAAAKPDATDSQQQQGKTLSQIKAAAVLSALASTSPRSLSSPKQHTTDAEGSKSSQGKKGEKRGGNFKWFRKGRKDKDHQQNTNTEGSKSPRTPRSLFRGMRNPTSPTGDIPKQVDHFTSPLQMQLWIGAVQQIIVKVKAEPDTKQQQEAEEAIAEDMMMQPPIQNPSSFYRHTVDTGVYVDYSTFDDGESVSSIDLLFKWLTCRDLTAEPKPSNIQTDQAQVESDVSFDAEAQPRRRVLFSP